MNLQPIADRVVILPDERLDRRPSGLLLNSVLGKEGAPETGRVVAVGPGRMDPKDGFRVPVGVAPGEKVWFKRLSGFDHKENGQQYYICRESEILGVVQL